LPRGCLLLGALWLRLLWLLPGLLGGLRVLRLGVLCLLRLSLLLSLLRLLRLFRLGLCALCRLRLRLFRLGLCALCLRLSLLLSLLRLLRLRLFRLGLGALCLLRLCLLRSLLCLPRLRLRLWCVLCLRFGRPWGGRVLLGRLCLRVLWCGRRRTLLWLALRFFRLTLWFLLPLLPRMRGDDGHEEQKQGSGTGSSNGLQCFFAHFDLAMG
jgi:hypothetical protein